MLSYLSLNFCLRISYGAGDGFWGNDVTSASFTVGDFSDKEPSGMNGKFDIYAV